MHPIRRLSLAEQTAAHLREGLLAGRWRGTLPGVARLAAELDVSAGDDSGRAAATRRRGPAERARPGPQPDRHRAWLGPAQPAGRHSPARRAAGRPAPNIPGVIPDPARPGSGGPRGVLFHAKPRSNSSTMSAASSVISAKTRPMPGSWSPVPANCWSGSPGRRCPASRCLAARTVCRSPARGRTKWRPIWPPRASLLALGHRRIVLISPPRPEEADAGERGTRLSGRTRRPRDHHG